jgi:hypothetical protein
MGNKKPTIEFDQYPLGRKVTSRILGDGVRFEKDPYQKCVEEILELRQEARHQRDWFATVLEGW